MKKNIIMSVSLSVVMVIGLFVATGFREKGQQAEVRLEYAQINVLESVVTGGAGRSRMLITIPGKPTEELELSNYYSLVGINFKNISKNEDAVIAALNKMSEDGWKVTSTASGGNDVYFTKYVMTREKR